MIFRKHISFFLVVLILVSNVGLSFNVHYCGATISSISLKTPLTETALEKNCCGIIEKTSHCCKDKVVHFQKKSENFNVKAFSFQANAPFVVQEWRPIIVTSLSHFKSSIINAYFCDANAPPLFKLYSQYVFYA